MIYILICLCIIAAIFLFPRMNTEGWLAYWFFFIIFVLIAGFRYKIGRDTYNYTDEYQNFPTLSQLNRSFINNSDYQILWILFESALRSITRSFYLLQIIVAIFVNFAVFNTIKKYSINPFTTILFYFLIFYLNLNMEIIRESICIALLLIGIDFLTKKKLIVYYILAIIAYLFHESGAVLFFVPLIFNLNLSRKSIISITIAVIATSGLIATYLIQKLPDFEWLNTNKIAYFVDTQGSSGTQLFNYIKYVILPSLILLIFYKRLNKFERNFIFLYIVFSILFTQLAIFFRIRDYFLILFLISVSNSIIKGFNKRFNHSIYKAGFIFIFLYVSLFRYYYYEKNDVQLYLNYYPYNSIMNENIPQARLDNWLKINTWGE